MMNLRISHKKIGEGSRVFVVAELSANHGHSFNLAVKTLKAMKESGADAVKLQTYTADTITINSNNKYFQIKHGTLWDGKNLYQLYQEAYTPWHWQPKLKKIAEDLGLIFFSSPFDKTAVDFLEEINVPAYKVASFEITDIPLIKYMAAKGKPVIISTGIADFSEIKEAVKACKEEKNSNIALLKCTSAYPAPLDELNLQTIPHMSKTFNLVIGLSDHSVCASVPVAAVALGAKIIEKHFILERRIKSPDSAFSLTPGQFKSMVKAIREVELALGEVNYDLTKEAKKGRTFRRSLFVVKDMEKGELFTKENIASIRPGFGLHPRYFDYVIGRKVKTDVKKGTPFVWNMVDKKSK